MTTIIKTISFDPLHLGTRGHPTIRFEVEFDLSNESKLYLMEIADEYFGDTDMFVYSLVNLFSREFLLLGRNPIQRMLREPSGTLYNFGINDGYFEDKEFQFDYEIAPNNKIIVTDIWRYTRTKEEPKKPKFMVVC